MTLLRLALVPVCLSASGCFIPGGGWTMRTGVDLRRMWKPSAFVELVDTKWDEFNRVEELNTTGFYGDQGASFYPGSPPIETAPPPQAPTSSSDPLKMAVPNNGLVPPPVVPRHEPTLLPGSPESSDDGPQTVQQSPLDGPQIPNADGTNSDGVTPVSKRSRQPLASRMFHRP